ncbi:MAG: type II secretion system protein [bacterium]
MKSGFTLVEMLVVVAIFTVISAVALFNQTKFSSDMVITNLAFEVALEMRQAQTYGIGVRGTSVSGSNFQYGYGVHFGGGQDNKTFLLFADSGTTKYAYDSGDTLLDTFHLSGGNTIAEICDNQSSAMTTGPNAPYCYKNLPLHSLDISFVRPNPEAHTIFDADTTVDVAPVYIVLRSSLGDKCKTVQLYSTGQISVVPSNTPCP